MVEFIFLVTTLLMVTLCFVTAWLNRSTARQRHNSSSLGRHDTKVAWRDTNIHNSETLLARVIVMIDLRPRLLKKV